MNKVVLIGRLTRDIEVRYAGEIAIAKFNLAVDRKIKKDGEPTADFINCTAFGKTAEFIEKYFQKGNKIVVVGRITTGSFTNKEGSKVYTTEVTVEEVEFGESKGNTESNQQPKQSNAEFMNIPDGVEEELPFN